MSPTALNPRVSLDRTLGDGILTLSKDLGYQGPSIWALGARISIFVRGLVTEFGAFRFSLWDFSAPAP